MFFENPSDVSSIATRTSCAVFVVSPDTKLNLPHPLYLRPDESKKTNIITVEQLRGFIALTNNLQTSDRYFVITPADAMNEAAQNAFLKTFEEPKAHCHFLLLTESPNSLLPTILSRAQIFFLRRANVLDSAPRAKDKELALAKRLVSAAPHDLPTLALELTKNKTQPREQALNVVATAIELLYKSYFKTKNPKFLSKLPNFLTLYDALSQNGHIKLHIVADLC